LTKADTHVPTGRLLSIVLRKHLGPDRAPGKILLNGMTTDIAAPLHAGDSVVTVPGPDAVEATRTVVETYPAMGDARLYVGGHPGTTRLVLGAVSGEVLSRRLVAAPVIGHLPAPGAVALTFDDGPNPAWTPRVLGLLAQAHAHATFCLIGRQVEQYPDLVRAIVAGGHTLCNHTWDHDEKLPTRTPDQVRSEMTRTQDAIKAVTGKQPRLFRAPAGAWSPEVIAIARSLHMTPLKWTVDPRDWAQPGTHAILVRTLARLRPGGVLLLHDGGGDRSQTFAALAQLLKLLPRLHYTYAVPQPLT
jgi:peptidoglycan/xylan/chitin deacetylase (PgdA/CDA1 family)